MTGTLTLTSSSTTSVVPEPDGVPAGERVMVPRMSLGLPGDSMLRAPPERSSHSSRWTARVVSPVNFRAMDGSPSVRWTWSLTRVNRSPVRSILTSWETTSWAWHTRSRKAGSASIS
jgi:hypothetical protein